MAKTALDQFVDDLLTRAEDGPAPQPSVSPTPRHAGSRDFLSRPLGQENTLATLYQELTAATPKADALAIFPDWQGLLVKSAVLGMSVWVVRSPLDGIALAKETGYPALLLDDVLRLKGHTTDEARAALLPVLITLEQ